MKEKSIKKSLLRRRFSRIILWLPVLLIALGIFLFSVVQIPKVQTKLLNKVSFILSENTGFDVQIGHANLTWFDYMIVKNFRLYDHQNDSTLIHVKDLQIDLKLYDFLVNRKLSADRLELNDAHINIVKETATTDVNISKFLFDLKELFRKHRKKNEKKTSVHLDLIEINNGYFSYNNMGQDSIATGKDYYHFRFDSIQAQISNFSFINDSLSMHIDATTAYDLMDQINVKYLESHFSFTKNQMIFSDFELKTDESHIRDSIVFKYRHPSNFKYFVDSISFYAALEETVLSTNELSLFAYKLSDINQSFNFSGNVSGDVKKLKLEDFTLGTGKNSALWGNASFNGLPDIEETFVNIDISESKLDPADLTNLMSKNIRPRAKNIGIVDFNGHFLGFLTDFVANGNIKSSVGKVNSDINFKIDDNKMASYNGQLTLEHFDLRSIFPNQSQLKHISLSGVIDGSGLTIANTQFNLDASIDSLTLYHYTYSNLATNGRFTDGAFSGSLSALDPHLNFDSSIDIDIKNERNKIKVKGSLDHINLLPIGLSHQDISMSTLLDVDLKGLKLDDLVGYISMTDNSLKIGKRALKIDTLTMISSLIDNTRRIRLDTEGLTAEMKGDFKTSHFIHDIRSLYKEIKMNIRNNESELRSYYDQKQILELAKYHVAIELDFLNLNRLLQPFLPSFYISEGFKISGNYVQDSISKLNLYGTIDSIGVAQNQWIDNYLDVNISKAYYNKNILASSFLSSEHQSWSNKLLSENAFADIIWFKDRMTASLNIEQSNADHQVAIESEVYFYPDSTSMHFNKSNIQVLDKAWNWNPANRITYQNREWRFDNVDISNDSERLEISGSYSEHPDKYLYLDLKKFDLQNFQNFTSFKLDGALDGRLKIKKQSRNDLIEGNLVARAVKVEDFLIGNIFGVSKWRNDIHSLALNLDLIQNNKRKIEIDGLFAPGGGSDQLDLIAKIDSADLKIIEPLLQKRFSNLGGYATGELTIQGNLNYPLLKGKGEVMNGKVLVDYLNTTYTFDGDLLFDENEISTQGLVLKDDEQNIALLSGGIFHDGFKNGVLDFQGEFENYKLLNTTSTDNSAYYGVAYGTGNISILGAINNLQITAEAQTAKGTRLFIPLGESSDSRIEQKEYIQFIDLKSQKIDTINSKNVKEQEKVNIRGVELDFDIEFTPDAYVELIFDVQSGDIIRGSGAGNIELQINTDGDFTMFGDLTIERGGYNFTLYNIINKEFDIKNGSKISWYGDPYGAQLDIGASYRQLTSLAPLMVKFLDPDEVNNVETRKKYPSIVDLNLKGNLLAPEISFDIDIEGYPQNATLPNSSVSFNEVVTAFKANLRNNEQEMNRQVFSLIVLRKFSPENSFQVNGQTISNSLSEFVSNQLSYWATQVDENLEVDVDLAGLSDDAFNTFQLRLSYTFLDGRLRVTRGGSLPNQETRGDVSTIIGDWTVEYLLTEDGRFRAKMYSRSDLDAIDQQLGESNFETGFSLQYIKSFNQLSQILSDNRKKNISKRKSSKSKIIENEEI